MLVAEAVHVPAQLGATRVPASQAAASPSSSTLTGAELPQAKKSCVSTCRVTSIVSESLRPCKLWPTRLLCQGGGFSRQEYWGVLANTGCHILLEHYISCCPSCHLSSVSAAARTLVTQAAAPPHLDLTEADPSPPGQLRNKPQWTTHMKRWK